MSQSWKSYEKAADHGPLAEPQHANPREVVEYAGDELRRASKDAERWRKVAPLIEALADVSINDGDDPQELEALRNALLAATKEP